MNNLGVVMLDLVGTTISETERDLLQNPQVGGVILFSRNFESKTQITRLCSDIHQIKTPPILIAVDQEGGRVQRFKDGFSRLPPMKKLGDLYDKDPELAINCAKNIGWQMADELRQVGVDFSFAPILDIDIGLSEVIGDRAFHHTPDGVSNLASAWINGMHLAGMPATAKHFPGHGSVVADSHIATPIDNRSKADIKNHDLIPFKRVKNFDAIMPAHVYYQEFDADFPAGFSKFWLQDILRQQLNFNGVIFSDDLTMHAASNIGDYPTRAKTALEAGCDMVLVCNNPSAAEIVIASLSEFENGVRPQRLLKMQGGKRQVDLSDKAVKSLKIIGQ